MKEVHHADGHVLSGPSLRERVAHAGIWIGLAHGVTRGAGVIRNVVLARLLAPDDFGLFGIALVALSFIERFSNSGLHAALVQKDNDVTSYLDAVWTVSVLRGLAVCGTFALAATPIAAILGDHRAAPFIALVGIAVLLRCLVNPGMVLYRRELETRYQFLHRAAGIVTELVVSVTLAFVLQSAWALVIGLVAGKLALLFASYALHPYRPRFSAAWPRVLELSRFGRWVYLDSIVSFLAYRGDNLIIGRIFGAPALGVYMLAYSISEVVALELSRVAKDIAFPAFSRLQADLHRVRRAFLRALDLVVSVTLPLSVILALWARPVTLALFGERWLAMATLLPALALAGAVRAVISCGTVALTALGMPALTFRTNVITVAVTYALMVPLISLWGLEGVAVSIAAGQIMTLLPFLRYLRRYLDISAHQFSAQLIPGATLALAVVIAGIGANWISRSQSWLSAIAWLAAAGMAYASTSLLIWRSVRKGPLLVIDLLRSGSRAFLS